MKNMNRQQGATLLVGMIMLVVLTLLTVFALRSSNTGVKIAGNLQARVEADGAAMKAIETIIELFKATEDVSLIPGYPVGSTPLALQIGDKTFSVVVAKPTCEMEVPVLESELNAADPNDVPCIEGSSGFDPVITAGGVLATKPSACKQQRWRIQVTVADAATGASVEQVQGIAIRVPAQTLCL